MMYTNDTRIHSSTNAILAVFDVDKTMVRGDSFKWFCWFAGRSNGMGWRWLWRFAFDTLKHPTNLLDAGRLKRACLRICLVNHDKAALGALAKSFVDCVLLKRVRSAAADRLRWHKQRNHTIMFLSASPDLYLNDFGVRLGADRVVCTRFLDQDGHFTGELYSANCKGDEKRRRLLEQFPAGEIAWNQSYGYGNSTDDAYFLELLGNPVAVNPDRKLRKLAAQHQWTIETWS
jgi:HAD superfamily hydrolase (TIGR01490 family)